MIQWNKDFSKALFPAIISERNRFTLDSLESARGSKGVTMIVVLDLGIAQSFSLSLGLIEQEDS